MPQAGELVLPPQAVEEVRNDCLTYQLSDLLPPLRPPKLRKPLTRSNFPGSADVPVGWMSWVGRTKLWSVILNSLASNSRHYRCDTALGPLRRFAQGRQHRNAAGKSFADSFDSHRCRSR